MPAPQHDRAAPRRWTVEEVRALMDETRHTPRYELIDGELLVSFGDDELGMTPSPLWVHQHAVSLLHLELGEYLQRQPVGVLLMAPADVELEPGTIVQPDLFILPLVTGEGFSDWTTQRGLLLAVEVLSPSTARRDRVIKRRFFQRMGVPEYWIVDANSRVVDRWRAGDERPELLDATLTWRPEGATEPFALDLAAYFARVHREG